MTQKTEGRTMPDNRVVNIRFLRKKMLPYVFVWIFYYAWIVTFATWWTASPLSETVFSTELREMMHAATLISSALFVLIIRKDWFIKVSRIGSVLIIIGMAVFFMVQDDRLRMLSALVSSVAMGCFNIGILIPFVFSLNNTEKLCAVVAGNVLIQIISLFLEANQDRLMEQVLSFFILAMALSAVVFFKKEDGVDQGDDASVFRPAFHKRIYLALLFNCAIAILCKGVGKGVLNVAMQGLESPVLIGHYVGGLTGCAVYVLIYAYTKRAYIWLGNITFASVAIGFLFYAFIVQVPSFVLPFAFLLGFGSTIGMINMYYILGVIGKKYDSLRFVRAYIFCIGLFGGASGIAIGRLISRIGTFNVTVAASIFSVVVMLAFMFFSPIMDRAEYVTVWGLDSQLSDIDNERLHCFQKYQMSRREIEVCKLLLQGYTMRQISGILSISYPTVNTYCTSIYRKTKINSRTELLQLFAEYINQ